MEKHVLEVEESDVVELLEVSVVRLSWSCWKILWCLCLMLMMGLSALPLRSVLLNRMKVLPVPMLLMLLPLSLPLPLRFPVPLRVPPPLRVPLPLLMLLLRIVLLTRNLYHVVSVGQLRR